MPKPPLIIIGGATATGKSGLAVALAQKLGAQIINADSMQLYKGMDIGTAKLAMDERGGIAHHLLDLVEVSQDVNVAWYQDLARRKIDELRAAGAPVIVVGGTGLYIKAILDEMNFPDTDPQVRSALEAEAQSIGGDALHDRLAQLDPIAAIAIPKANVRRTIRALEVIEITGAPYTANLPREGSDRYPEAIQLGLALDRELLDPRIDTRVEKMWELGLVEEVRDLIGRGLLEGKTARRAIGYAQVIAMAEGLISDVLAKEETKAATRQYARRQETWFKRDERIHWFAPASPEVLLERALTLL